MSENPRKKVLLAITKSNFGGAQRYVYDLATAMPREQFDIVVAFGEGGELEEKLQDAGIRTIKIGRLQRNVNVLKDFSVFFGLIKIFKKEKPDVVHLNSTKIGGVGALAGRFCRVPKIIFTAHGWAFNEKRNIVSKVVIVFLQWLTVKLAHTTIVVSQKTADQILKFPFIKKNKIKVIYNGIADIDFVAREAAQQRLLDKGNLITRISETPVGVIDQTIKQPFWIGTIAELHINKGIDIALNAMTEIAQKYPKAIYVVIGEGQARSRLTAQIIKLNLANRAFLVGSVADARKYLKAFDIFVLTSRTEALPYAILEAGLAELPVVASSVGGIPEIINLPDVGLLVQIDKKASQVIARAFANTIESLMANPEHAKTLGQNLRNRVLKEFSVQKMQNETFALYK